MVCVLWKEQTLRLWTLFLSAIGIASCVGASKTDQGAMRAAVCMADILKAVPTARDVATGTAYETREGYVPTLKYNFANSSGRHAVQINISGTEAVGYGYFQSDVPSLLGNPVTADVQHEWLARCRADALAVTS